MTSEFTLSLFAANNCLLLLGTRLVIDETQPNSKATGKKTKTVSWKELKYDKLIRYTMTIFLSVSARAGE